MGDEGAIISNCKGMKKIRTTTTQREAYARVQPTRLSERALALRFFHDHPNEYYFRHDLQNALGLPINHITRVVRDLLDDGVIEVCGMSINPVSGRLNELIHFKVVSHERT